MRAGSDPVKTVILLAPESCAGSMEGVREFARRSGWTEQVEQDAAVLVAPVAPDGWDVCPTDLPLALYQRYRRSFEASGNGGIAGRGGRLWAWETLIYVVGYAGGAVLAGEFLLAHPGVAAATILVDGRPRSLDALDAPSEHWLVDSPADYALRNRDVPVAVWLMGEESDDGAMERALLEVDGATDEREVRLQGHVIRIHENPDAPAEQVRVSSDLTGEDPDIARLGMEEFFDRIIRWKNAPDGTLAPRLPRREFYEGSTFLHRSIVSGGNTYPYAVYLPAGLEVSDVAGLPLVISLHGRGEPVWLFSYKNGWEDLADETRAFAVLLPDSPGNLWLFERDADALEAIVCTTVDELSLDASRVYLTGFSMGALFTCQMATSRPQIFAAASPWNSPGEAALTIAGTGGTVYNPDFVASGCDMPFWICYGDSDDKAPLVHEAGFDVVLEADGCGPEPTEVWDAGDRYTGARGYQDGDRMRTEVYRDAEGIVRAGFTVMKNMPHGTIADEARAAWEFMRRFRRSGGAKKVEVLE